MDFELKRTPVVQLARDLRMVRQVSAA